MPSHTLSNIEASTSVHVLCYPSSTEGMTTYSFLESTGACSGLHELPNARAVHMAQLRYFLVFSKRWEKGSSTLCGSGRDTIYPQTGRTRPQSSSPRLRQSKSTTRSPLKIQRATSHP